jgi:transcriptional antiterminator RfaH
MKWFVLYTKSNFEIKVSEKLNNNGIEAYCPVYTEIKQYSDRKKKVVKPLLKSYVLVKIKEKDRVKVFEIPGVLRYLYWLGKPATVRDQEINMMEEYLSSKYKSINIKSINKGEAYSINKGPFKGYKGKVVTLLKNKIKLELQSLGMLVTLKTA